MQCDLIISTTILATVGLPYRSTYYSLVIEGVQYVHHTTTYGNYKHSEDWFLVSICDWRVKSHSIQVVALCIIALLIYRAAWGQSRPFSLRNINEAFLPWYRSGISESSCNRVSWMQLTAEWKFYGDVNFIKNALRVQTYDPTWVVFAGRWLGM